MRKLVLSLSTIALLSIYSCEKEKTDDLQDVEKTDVVVDKNQQETEIDKVGDTAKIKVPEFSTPELTKFARDYAEYRRSENSDQVADKAWSERTAKMLGEMNDEDLIKWRDLSEGISKSNDL